MERRAVEGSWQQLKSAFKGKWTKLTIDDIEGARGRIELLSVALQKRYGVTRSVAVEELNVFIAGITPVSAAGGL
jgi:hypothetical protein